MLREITQSSAATLATQAFRMCPNLLYLSFFLFTAIWKVIKCHQQQTMDRHCNNPQQAHKGRKQSLKVNLEDFSNPKTLTVWIAIIFLPHFHFRLEVDRLYVKRRKKRHDTGLYAPPACSTCSPLDCLSVPQLKGHWDLETVCSQVSYASRHNIFY